MKNDGNKSIEKTCDTASHSLDGNEPPSDLYASLLETTDNDNDHRIHSQTAWKGRRVVLAFLSAAVVLVLCSTFNDNVITSKPTAVPSSNKKIIVITPTHRRHTRLADLVRLKNTLIGVPNVYWIVVEDGLTPALSVERILRLSGLEYTYFGRKTKPGYPRRGWYQRDEAIQYLRANHKAILGRSSRGVVYFADDDNSYDTRLFNEYIRNVKKMGTWAVGLVGGAAIESPQVENGKVVGWNVEWNPQRRFATDMAGFAISTDVLLHSSALFGQQCKKGRGAPETCFIEALGLEPTDLEPFGYEPVDTDRLDSENATAKKEVLVWHTKTKEANFDKRKVDFYGYSVE